MFENYMDWIISSQASKLDEGSETIEQEDITSLSRVGESRSAELDFYSWKRF